MAYNKSSGGCTPITAKIKKTTQGGVVQPLLNMGAPVKMKASSPAKNMTARQKANESRLKARIATGEAKAAAEKALELKKAKDLASKEFVTNKRGRKVKNPKYQAPSIQPVNETSKNKTGSIKANRELKDVLERKGIDVSSYKGDTRPKMKKGTYRYAKASQPGLDNIISKRNKATKGTAEYNRYQNQINKAYGVGPTNRSTTVKTASTIKPKVTIETKKPTASTDISALKPKASKITNERAAKRSARKTAKAQKVRQKGIEALESGNLTKARRLKKREERINKRAKRQADKAIKPKSPAKQTAKQQQQKQKREKELARAKFIKKAEKKGNLKDLKKNPPKVKRVYK